MNSELYKNKQENLQFERYSKNLHNMLIARAPLTLVVGIMKQQTKNDLQECSSKSSQQKYQRVGYNELAFYLRIYPICEKY